jgi:SAM-dependent methyltransferase
VTRVYDDIGRGYLTTRRPDPRIARAIHAALGEARSVANVGAGSGSYEPRGLRLVAIEPSREMLRQRPLDAAPAIQAAAEALPLADAAVDAALAVLTLHHWDDQAAGLAELCRVARQRVVVVTWDPAARDAFWLTTHYFPEIVALDVGRFPAIDTLARHLPDVHVEPLLVPHDCEDGFLGAFWRRPEAYLIPAVRQAMSGFAQLPPGVADAGLARLADDLRSGYWQARFGDLARAATADLGYRLVIARVDGGGQAPALRG